MAYIEVPPEVLTADLELICDGEWHYLDFPTYAPPLSTSTDAHTYINIKTASVPPVAVSASLTINGVAVPVSLKVPSVGRLRICMVREPFNGAAADETYYFDIDLFDGKSRLDSRSMFEDAEKGRPLRWMYRVSDATAVTLDTRYVKYRHVLGEVKL